MEWQPLVEAPATRRSYGLARKRKFSGLKVDVRDIDLTGHQLGQQIISQYRKRMILTFQNTLLCKDWNAKVAEFRKSFGIRNNRRDIFHGAARYFFES